jgi:hypothetical protein
MGGFSDFNLGLPRLHQPTLDGESLWRSGEFSKVPTVENIILFESIEKLLLLNV